MMIIHKISVDGTDISYEGKGEVPGRILNQFSMDEYDGYFRTQYRITLPQFEELRQDQYREAWIAWLTKNQ